MRFLKYGLAIALVAVMALSVAGCSKEPLAGKVNGKEITMAEVDKKLAQLVGEHGELLQGAEGEQMKEDLKHRILDQLIDMELVLQEADKRNIKVSDKEIDDKIKDLMLQFGIEDDKALQESLKQQNMTMAQLKKEIADRVKIEKLGEEVTKGLKVTDKEIEEYYNKNKERYKTEDQVLASHILVQDEEEAKRILKEIKDGADFAKLAKENSIDPGSKDNGGQMDWADKDKFVPEFAEASWKLEPGQISDPVKTSYGYHIIKLGDKRPANQRQLAEVKDDIEGQILNEKKREAFVKWLEDTKKKADIKKYLTKNDKAAPSGEPGVAPEGTPKDQAPVQPGENSGK